MHMAQTSYPDQEMNPLMFVDARFCRGKKVRLSR